MAGLRERDFRNGMNQLLGRSLIAKLPYLPDVLAHPGWVAAYLMGASMPALPNVVMPGEGPLPMTDVAKALSRSVVTWEDLDWIREAMERPHRHQGRADRR